MRLLWPKLKTIAITVDRIIEIFAVSGLAVMTLIVTMQVLTRKLMDFVFIWSEEITLLLLIWFSFLGIAIGFRDKLHIAMDAVAKRLPGWARRGLDILIPLSNFLFGAFLIVNGWDFTVLMSANTMAATGWSSSVMYVIMPITGIMICFYSILHLFGIDTEQHKHLDEELGE
ncbi:TRAP transporter small permease [Paenibacillus soyae]|uniref:TRAP transporter small permease n=1 Tax=Paenibacillus soyae TaxID=2969249 RepID=A0A9X2MXH6_9BACL|nr:TRAP transporter small permease [Paenibacillus soyae]MCR2807708.1 TRAP transporter small permease [Paenibacillus soyae]